MTVAETDESGVLSAKFGSRIAAKALPDEFARCAAFRFNPTRDVPNLHLSVKETLHCSALCIPSSRPNCRTLIALIYQQRHNALRRAIDDKERSAGRKFHPFKCVFRSSRENSRQNSNARTRPYASLAILTRGADAR